MLTFPVLPLKLIIKKKALKSSVMAVLRCVRSRGGKNVFDLVFGATGTSLHVSPGDLLREQGGRRKTYRKPERKRQTVVGEGEFKNGAGTVGGAEGRRKVGHGISVAQTFSLFLFSGERAASRAGGKTGQRGQTNQQPLWITFASELFTGRVSLRINVVVNLWKLF